MMFLIHAAFALGLMSLTAGAALYIWALRNKGTGSGIGRVIGFIVIIISTLSLVCCFYLGAKIWKEIYYLNIVQMHNSSSMQSESPVKAPKEHHQRR